MVKVLYPGDVNRTQSNKNNQSKHSKSIEANQTNGVRLVNIIEQHLKFTKLNPICFDCFNWFVLFDCVWFFPNSHRYKKTLCVQMYLVVEENEIKLINSTDPLWLVIVQLHLNSEQLKFTKFFVFDWLCSAKKLA